MRILALVALLLSSLSLVSLVLAPRAASLGPYLYNDTIGSSGYWYLYGYGGELAYIASRLNLTLSLIVKNIVVNVTASNLTLVNASINRAYLVMGGTVWERYGCHQVCDWTGNCQYECSTDYYHIAVFLPLNLSAASIRYSYLYSSTNHTYENITILFSGETSLPLSQSIILERLDTHEPAVSLSYYTKQIVPLPGLGAHVSSPISPECQSNVLTNTFSQPVSDSLCLAQLNPIGIALLLDAELKPWNGTNSTSLNTFIDNLNHPLYDARFSGYHKVIVIYRDLEYNSTNDYELFNGAISNGWVCQTLSFTTDGNLTLYPCTPRRYYGVSTEFAETNETNTSVTVRNIYWYIPLSGLVNDNIGVSTYGLYLNLVDMLFNRAPPALFNNFYLLESKYTSIYYIPPTVTPNITLTITPPVAPPSPSPVFRLYKPSLSSPVGFLAIALFVAIFVVMSPVLGYLNALWLTMGVVLVYGLVVRDTYLMLIGFLGIVGAPMLRYIRSG